MNITKETVGSQHAVLKVQLTPEDYASQVEQGLKGYKKSARLPGFRPGHVPDGIIRKMYGKYVLMDEVGKVTSEAITKYISDEKLQLLGDPLPVENEEPVDWKYDGDYTFSFEIGIAPAIEVNLSKDDKIKAYEIQPDQEMEDAYIRNYARRFGQFVSRDTVSEGDEMLKGKMVELNEDKTPKEGGVVKEEASIYLEFLKDEETRKQFIGRKAGDEVIIELQKAFPNEVEISSMLGIDKAAVKDLQPQFSFTLATVARFENAALDTALFDKGYGEGQVKTEEEFRGRIREEIAQHLAEDAEYKFRVDVRSALLDKFPMDLPEEFLKKWMRKQSKDEKEETAADKDYEGFSRDLKWQLIVNEIIRSQKIEIAEADVVDFARDIARRQFAQYGMLNVPEENIEGYARTMLQNEQEARRIFEQLYEQRALQYVRETVTLDTAKVSMDEYRSMLAAEQPQSK